MSELVKKLNKRAVTEMNTINWTKELQKTVNQLLKDRPFEKSLRVNAEFADNLSTAQEFILRVIQKKKVIPETFFFAV